MLAEQYGTTPRQLQRLFAEYIGVGPNWTIRRFGLEEPTDRMASGVRVDWPALAAELGYADQAHSVRDFARLFGESPTRYAERYRTRRLRNLGGSGAPAARSSCT
ncbi:helix-turn-helix domain-containing protein [Nocardia shimofusensis]|uniref:helix-turn-helix domain-containing protein n=1 Tax=Nocardia shimofusensis TaxID=228596 RepID=UPI000AADD344|nr:helix-turn-helix domain-containing protein [Nocardia shimofusensis]